MSFRTFLLIPLSLLVWALILWPGFDNFVKDFCSFAPSRTKACTVCVTTLCAGSHAFKFHRHATHATRFFVQNMSHP